MSPKLHLLAALMAFAAEGIVVRKGKVGKVAGRSKAGNDYEFAYAYADLSDLLAAITPFLVKHQLVITHQARCHDGAQFMRTTITHAPSGESISAEAFVAPYAFDAQQRGSAGTYVKRQSLVALLNLNVAGDDDDGKTASRPPAKPQQQRKRPADDRPEIDKLLDAIAKAQSLDKLNKVMGHGKTTALLADADSVDQARVGSAVAAQRKIIEANTQHADARSQPQSAERKPPLTLVARAGILCADPRYWSFLAETMGVVVTNADEAAAELRGTLGIESRSTLDTDKVAAPLFVSREDEFIAWRLSQ